MNRDMLVAIVKDVAKPIAESFGLPLVYEAKEGLTSAAAAVTAIDRDIQAKLMSVLSGDFMGEEDGERITGNSKVWLTDPLDGTGARIRGLASSTCIVTLMDVQGSVGSPILTVIHNPITDQTWSAELGQGAFYQFRNNQETRCILNNEVGAPTKILSTITLWPGNDYRFDEVKKAVEADSRFDTQDFGALGAAHASVTTGTTHLSACRASAAYETAAAALLTEEAGGVTLNLKGLPITTFPIQDVRGKTTFAIPDGSIVASSNTVAQSFLELVQRTNA